MKKLHILLMLLAAGMFVVPGSALCYTIDDSTGDYIGEPIYEIYGMDIIQGASDITLQIYTDLPDPGENTIHSDPFSWTTFAGDLAIDLYDNGTYDYGVAFSQHALYPDPEFNKSQTGQLYSVDTGIEILPYINQGWWTSNWYYETDGKKAEGFTWNHDEIVTIAAGSPVAGSSSVDIDWTSVSGESDYRIDVTLNPADFLPADFQGKIAFRWASGTCANDIVEGHLTYAPVPEPATMLLLGCGLIGLAGFGRKRLSRK